MSGNAIPESLITLLRAVAEDRRLRDWLLSLYQLPSLMRRAQLEKMAGRIRSAPEDAPVAEALTALTRPSLFEAACGLLGKF
jgi:hypothetical protein